MTDTPLLVAENITKTLPLDVPVTLVREANVTVRRGEFVAIVGPSGSGKSSLLYLLGLLDRPTSGQIRIDGQDISAMSDEEIAALRLEKLGFIFQSHFLLPEFSALENVMIPMRRLARLSDTEIKAQALKVLRELGLEEHAHKKPKQLSGGQNQRVAIARALANDPALLLADEPTGNLDTVSSKKAQDILRDVAHKHNRAVIVVTHDMDFAASADRIIRIVDSKILV
jgi:lipoprotein-releasing system ATP-binding protein